MLILSTICQTAVLYAQKALFLMTIKLDAYVLEIIQNGWQIAILANALLDRTMILKAVLCVERAHFQTSHKQSAFVNKKEQNGLRKIIVASVYLNFTISQENA